MPELVAQGYGVKLDGIGIFYPVIANQKGGAQSVEAFNIAQNVKGVRFKFRPDSTDLDDLTVKAFGKKVTLGNGYYKEEKGAKAPLIPLAAAVVDEDASASGGGSSNTGGNNTPSPNSPEGEGTNTEGDNNGGGGNGNGESGDAE